MLEPAPITFNRRAYGIHHICNRDGYRARIYRARARPRLFKQWQAASPYRDVEQRGATSRALLIRKTRSWGPHTRNQLLT